jgi:DNA-binding NarL/FixJ family response regulator
MRDENDRTTILIVDDHALVRQGLRKLLETQEDLRVVGEAREAGEAVTLAAETEPDIVLLDVEIPGGEVTETVRRIREDSPRSRIIILSMHEGPDLVQATLAAGVRAYLLKSVHWEELVVAIRAVHADGDRVILGVSQESLHGARHRPEQGVLSDREHEVLGLVAQALSNGQIASRLGLTEATVKRHLRNIFTKLGAVSRLDAVNKAKEQQQHAPRRPSRIPGRPASAGESAGPVRTVRSPGRDDA